MSCSCSRSSPLATAAAVSVSVSVTMALFFLAFFSSGFHAEGPIGETMDQTSSGVGFHGRLSLAGAASNRKLLQEESGGGRPSASSSSSLSSKRTDRIGDECSKDDIVVHQGATSPMPNGIPTYTVEILNVCAAGAGACSMAHIHLSCGWFSSARLINPRIFRRIGYDDCLLNDGRPLPPGSSLSFQYANSFRYPLSVASASCAP